MANFIIGGIVLIAVGAAVAYIIKEKKRGVKCIGCGVDGGCSGCGCSCGTERK